MRCGNCGYVWIYGGESEYYATCPRCLRKVNIRKQRDAGPKFPGGRFPFK